MSKVAASAVDHEIEEIEESIRRLQSRADLLRRIRQTPSVEELTEVHARFVGVHKQFCQALDAFGAETTSLFRELAVSLGHSDCTDFQDWLAACGDSGRAFRDAERAFAEFCVDVRTALYHDARKELELMFLSLKGFHPINGWFEFLLRKEGQIRDDTNRSEPERA